MVVALGPGRFYGSSLPRPRFFPGDRVDLPTSVTDPLLAWAREAHWSMGGLSSKRLRLQGRIEGSIIKLRRCDARAAAKARAADQRPSSLAALGSDDDGTDLDEEVEAQERILKREVVDEEPESDESEEDEEEALATIAAAAKTKRARKLRDEFDHLAALQQEGKAKKQKPAAASPAMTSPRGKAAAMASTPAARTPAGTSLRSKAAAAASTPVVGARRTSPRNKDLVFASCAILVLPLLDR